MPDPTEEHDVAPALQFLRANREGVFRFDEHTQPVRFVLDPETGRVVFPCMVAALLASQHVLHTPDESDGSMHLLLSPEEIDADTHPAPDRWRIHFGDEPDVNWVAWYVDMARWRGAVYDGDALMTPNPLATAEPRLVKKLNADRRALIRLCLRFASREVAEPTAVAVDPDGLDIRARFGIMRVAFETPAETPERAEARIDEMFK